MRKSRGQGRPEGFVNLETESKVWVESVSARHTLRVSSPYSALWSSGLWEDFYAGGCQDLVCISGQLEGQ